MHTVLHKYQYITPHHVIQKIHEQRWICQQGPYLHCVIQYAEVTSMTSKFAQQLQLPELECPDTFLRHFDEMDLISSEDTPEPVTEDIFDIYCRSFDSRKG